MNRYAYLSVIGSEKDIGQLRSMIDLDGARVVTPRGGIAPRVIWNSPKQLFADPPAPDEVSRFFERYGDALAPLLGFAPGTFDIYLEIVAEGGPPDDETPGGFFLSASDIAWIGRFGAALDIDLIWRI